MRYVHLLLSFILCFPLATVQAQTSTPSILFAQYANADPAIAYTFNDTDWYYLAITKPLNNQGAIYVNGELAGQIDWENHPYDHNELNIGAAFNSISGSFADYFAGTIDEIRISSNVKSASFIKAHYAANQAFEKETATVQILQFDEGSGKIFLNIDMNKSGSLTGNPIWVDGKFGKAIKYDGQDDRARILADVPEYNVTYEMWVKFDGGITENHQTMLQPFGEYHTNFGVYAGEVIVKPPQPSPIFVLGTANVANDEIATIPLTVKDFKNILTAQFTITWDAALAEFQEVKDFALSDLNASSFNRVDDGTVTLSWSRTTGESVTLDDNTVICNLVFRATGVPGQTTDLAFGSIPTLQEVTDADKNILGVTYLNGKINISGEVRLAGTIKTQTGEAIPGVEVELTGGATKSIATDENGRYSFWYSQAGNIRLPRVWTTMEMRA
ncbi:MAG: hypothetical protein HC819_11145 [Cyclobacteriaceae bacterium]|nr:hypothetical protein [Cyclobacteriaceae bacterium]